MLPKKAPAEAPPRLSIAFEDRATVIAPTTLQPFPRTPSITFEDWPTVIAQPPPPSAAKTIKNPDMPFMLPPAAHRMVTYRAVFAPQLPKPSLWKAWRQKWAERSQTIKVVLLMAALYVGFIMGMRWIGR